MKLGIDLDGVVVDFVGACADILEYFIPDDVLFWDDIFTLSKLTPKEFFDEVEQKDVFWQALPVSGAVSGILRLADAGHEIVFITHRPYWAEGHTGDWLSHYFSRDLNYTLHVLSNGESKSTVSCDLYLDDAPHVLTDLMDNHRRVVRFERPWNKDSKDWDFSVANWEEFVTLVDDIKNRKATPQEHWIMPGPRVAPTMAHPQPSEYPTELQYFDELDKAEDVGASPIIKNRKAKLVVRHIPPGPPIHPTMAFPAPVPMDPELERLLAEEEEIEARCATTWEQKRAEYFPGTQSPASMMQEIGDAWRDKYDAPAEDDAEIDAFIEFCCADSDEVRMTDPATGGQKGSKPERMDLLPWDALMEVSAHYGAGAEKYEDRNWERGYSWHLTFAALQRHLAAWWQGEDLDDEGLEHLNAVVFHALALRTFTLRNIGTDDRPLRSPQTSVLRHLSNAEVLR